MRALAIVLVLITGCEARFSSQVPRSYKCASAGSTECPGGWVCNQTVGFCFNPDSGLPLACANDDECGGGWRCSPNQLCVDRSVEGQVTVAAPVTIAPFVSPLLLRTGAMTVSDPANVEGSGTRLTGFDVLFDSPATGRQQWLAEQESASPSEINTDYRLFELVDAQSGVVTTSPVFDDGGSVFFAHSVWVLADGAAQVRTVVRDVNDGGLTMKERSFSGTFTSLGVVRSEGFATHNDSLRGAALLIGPTGTQAWQFNRALASYQFAPATTEVAWLDGRLTGGSPCTSLVAAMSPSGTVIRQGVDDGGTAVFADGQTFATQPTWTRELRTAASSQGDSVEVGALSSTGNVQSMNACTTAINSVPGCLQRSDGGLTYTNWNYHEVGLGLLPRLVCNADATQLIFNTVGGGGQQIYDLLQFSTDGLTGIARAGGSNAVVRMGKDSSPLSPVSMSAVPDALTSFQGVPVAIRRDGAYALNEVGFLRTFNATDPSENLAVSDGRFLVRRSGVVSTTTWAVAFPPTPWALPSAPVVLRTAALTDGGTLLALAHDDTIDMAQLIIATKTAVELAPMVVPSPGLAVTDFALHVSTDGGFATGYAITSGVLIALSASSPTRWQSTRVALPDDVLHVYYDGELPRAVSASGRVLGLTALVGLTPPTPAPAIAATSVCNTPFVMTDDSVFQLSADGGWRAVELAPDTDDPSSPAEPPSLTGGRLLTLDGGVFVFDRQGHSWAFKVRCAK